MPRFIITRHYPAYAPVPHLIDGPFDDIATARVALREYTAFQAGANDYVAQSTTTPDALTLWRFGNADDVLVLAVVPMPTLATAPCPTCGGTATQNLYAMEFMDCPCGQSWDTTATT